MRIAAKWGLILGVTIALWTLALHALGFYTTNIAAGQVADVVATIFPIAAVALALRERKLTPPTIGGATATALVVGVVSLAITIPFFWWYHHVANPQWSEHIVAYLQASLGAAGRTPAEIESAVAAQRASATDGAQMTGALVGTVVLSVVIGLLAGAILKFRARRVATANAGG